MRRAGTGAGDPGGVAGAAAAALLVGDPRCLRWSALPEHPGVD